MPVDCIFDWEPVQLQDELTVSKLVSWLLGLHDRLTVTCQHPLGEELMVYLYSQQLRRAELTPYPCCCSTKILQPVTFWVKPSFVIQIPKNWFVPTAAEKIRTVNGTRQDISLRAVIEAQLEDNTASLMLPKYLLVVFQLSL